MGGPGRVGRWIHPQSDVRFDADQRDPSSDSTDGVRGASLNPAETPRGRNHVPGLEAHAGRCLDLARTSPDRSLRRVVRPWMTPIRLCPERTHQGVHSRSAARVRSSTHGSPPRGYDRGRDCSIAVGARSVSSASCLSSWQICRLRGADVWRDRGSPRLCAAGSRACATGVVGERWREKQRPIAAVPRVDPGQPNGEAQSVRPDGRLRARPRRVARLRQM
jgi:hypothetical protein